MPISDLDLDAIRSRLAAASEGPWRTHDTDLGNWGGHTATVLGPERREPGSRPGWDRITTEGIAWLPTFERSPRAPRQNPWNNATFIAEARQDVPALLAEVERLRAALGALNAAAYEQEEPSKALLDASGEADEVLGITRPYVAPADPSDIGAAYDRAARTPMPWTPEYSAMLQRQDDADRDSRS